MKILFLIGILVIALVVYLLGNLIFGVKRKGGLRSVAFISGVVASGLGGMLVKTADKTIATVSGSILAVFGVYIILVAIFASNRKVEEIVEGLGNGL